MWELIKENQRKSLIIFIAMGICLILLGYILGLVFSPPDGAIPGTLIALSIWIILSLISFFSGDSIMLAINNAKEVTHDIHPQLFNIVEEMKIAANLPAMPRVYIIDDPSPNAFATGRSPQNCAIAVTTGLLSRLNRDELEGVIAHETSHIMNRDVQYVTFAGVMLGSIALISDIFLRGMRFSGSSRRYSSRSSFKAGGQAQAIILIIAIIFAILAPILARIFYFALSRKREYLADASGVRLTRYPEGLASALENIAYSNIKPAAVNKITAPMFIVNPLEAKGASTLSLFSTHPPIEKRVKILRSMSEGVNYVNYQKAFSAVSGQSARVMPLTALCDLDNISVRKPSPDKKVQMDAKQKARDLGDLMWAINNYAFLICTCGLKIKLPPNYLEKSLKCPRCGRELEVPMADVKSSALASSAAITKGEASELESLVYKRSGANWESFSCSCGKILHISPLFAGSQLTCQSCGREIEIKS